jgi:hypothetical protein
MLFRRTLIGSLVFMAACSGVTAETMAATLYRIDCQAISPRVPAEFAELSWIAEAPADTHVFSGEAIASAPPEESGPSDETNSWIVGGGIYMVLREVDLNGDGRCDLVATAKSVVGTTGDFSSSLVFWFASAKGWRRQGPDWGTRSSKLNPVSRALLDPDNPADFALYGFGRYLPARVAGAGVVLAARPSAPRAAPNEGPVTVLAYDRKTSTMAPLAKSESLARQLGELGDLVCVAQQSEDEACLTWFE